VSFSYHGSHAFRIYRHDPRTGEEYYFPGYNVAKGETYLGSLKNLQTGKVHTAVLTHNTSPESGFAVYVKNEAGETVTVFESQWVPGAPAREKDEMFQRRLR